MTRPAIRTIARNAAYLVGTRGINLLIRTVWLVAAARLLGPDLYALLAYSQTWQLAFLPLALFGVGPALSYLIGPDRSRVSDYAGHVLAIRLVTIVIAIVACVALSRVVTPDPRASELIAVLSLAMAAAALGAFAQTLFTAFEVNQHTLRQTTIFSLLELTVALSILLGGGSLLMLVTARVLVAWLQTATALLIVHREVVPIRIVWRPSQWGPLLRLAVPALISSLAVDWSFSGSLLLFRNLSGDGILFGQFALAMQVMAIVAIVPLASSRAVFPALRRAVARGDGKELRFASVMQRAAPVVGTAAGLFGWVIGEPLFTWLLGEPFSTAGELVGLTLWCLIALTAAAGYPEVMLAHGRFRAMVTLHVIGAIVMTSLTFMLVPQNGVTGAITAAILGFSVSPAGAFVLAWRQNMADPIDEVIRPFAAAALGIVAYLALASFSRSAALVGGLLVLAAATLALHVITPAEVRALRDRFSFGRFEG